MVSAAAQRRVFSSAEDTSYPPPRPSSLLKKIKPSAVLKLRLKRALKTLKKGGVAAAVAWAYHLEQRLKTKVKKRATTQNRMPTLSISNVASVSTLRKERWMIVILI